VFLEIVGGFDELGIFIDREGVISGESALRVGTGVACGGIFQFHVLAFRFTLGLVFIVGW
jgi:hypothetical protein